MTIKNLKGNRILVKRVASLNKTLSGIYIPDQLIENRNIGTVVMVGETADESLVDKQVMFQPFAGKETEHNGETHLIMFTIEIIATL